MILAGCIAKRSQKNLSFLDFKKKQISKNNQDNIVERFKKYTSNYSKLELAALGKLELLLSAKHLTKKTNSQKNEELHNNIRYLKNIIRNDEINEKEIDLKKEGSETKKKRIIR